MGRIPYLTEDEVTPRIREFWEKSPVILNINRVAAHAESVYKQSMGMGAMLMLKAELPARVRELAILRIAHLCKAEYEWEHHARLAVGIGFAEEEVEAVKDWENADCLDERDKLALRFTDEVVLNVRASDETYSKMAENLSHRQMVELILSIGYWSMIARLIVNADIELEKEV